MRDKGSGQRSVLDDLLDNRKEQKHPKKIFLEEIDAYVDWGIYRRPLEHFYKQSA